MKEKLLNELRSIVKNKKLMFPTEYINKSMPKIGVGGRGIFGVSRKYVFVNCWAEPCVNEQGEHGLAIKKYPLISARYREGVGKVVDKVSLDDLFTEDIEHLLQEVKYFIWLQTQVELPKLESRLKELREYKKMYDSIAPFTPLSYVLS